MLGGAYSHKNRGLGLQCACQSSPAWGSHQNSHQPVAAACSHHHPIMAALTGQLCNPYEMIWSYLVSSI